MSQSLKERSLDLLITQYRDAESYRAFVSVPLEQVDECESVSGDVVLISDIDTSEGEQLDNIGRIVGFEARPMTYPSYPFGLEDAVDARGFDAGGLVAVEDVAPEDGSDISDANYRLLLKAKIKYNTSNCTIEDMVRHCLDYMGFLRCDIFPGRAFVHIATDRALVGSDNPGWLYLPIAGGVELLYSFNTGERPFGYGFTDRETDRVSGFDSDGSGYSRIV